MLDAFLNDADLKKFTGDILHDPRVKDVGYEGRLYLAHTPKRYDVVDLSLADSAGLSNPGGFAIVEKYPYTREAMENYMRALKPGGVLSVTLWNKEEPPKSVLKLYATMAAAAQANKAPSHDKSFSSPPAICRPQRCCSRRAVSATPSGEAARPHQSDVV